MMLSDVCRVDPVGGLHGAYWLIGPGSASLAQGCRCALLLQPWAGAYRGGRPPTACLQMPFFSLFSLLSLSVNLG